LKGTILEARANIANGKVTSMLNPLDYILYPWLRLKIAVRNAEYLAEVQKNNPVLYAQLMAQKEFQKAIENAKYYIFSEDEKVCTVYPKYDGVGPRTPPRTFHFNTKKKEEGEE